MWLAGVVAAVLAGEGFAAGDVARWNAFIPDAIATLAAPDGLDPGLESAREHMRRSLAALEDADR